MLNIELKASCWSTAIDVISLGVYFTCALVSVSITTAHAGEFESDDFLIEDRRTG